MSKKLAVVGITAGLALGGVAGFAFGTPGISAAQTTPPTTPVATSAPAGAPTKPAMNQRLTDVLAKLVTDGTITQVQADKVASAIEAARPAGGMHDGQGRDGRGGFGGPGMTLDAAAKALGMTAAELRTAVQGGQTIAQVAASKNVPVQTVIDAMVAGFKAQETSEIASGQHTQAEVDQKVADFTTRAADIVNGKAGPIRGGRAADNTNPATPAAPATTGA